MRFIANILQQTKATSSGTLQRRPSTRLIRAAHPTTCSSEGEGKPRSRCTLAADWLKAKEEEARETPQRECYRASISLLNPSGYKRKSYANAGTFISICPTLPATSDASKWENTKPTETVRT